MNHSSESMPVAWLARVAQSHAQQGRHPGAVFAALNEAAAAVLGHRLFTVLRFDRHARQAQRVYTSQPDAYPLNGSKPIADSPWVAQVLERGEPYIARDADDIRATFADHAQILSLGCASALNLPVCWQGETLGTLNLLHQEDWYRPAHLAFGLVLAQLALPALRAPARACF